MMIGTKKVRSRLSGNLVSALIDAGSAAHNLPAVATTKRISNNPNTFQMKKEIKPLPLFSGEVNSNKEAAMATAISPKPPGTAKAYGSSPRE